MINVFQIVDLNALLLLLLLSGCGNHVYTNTNITDKIDKVISERTSFPYGELLLRYDLINNNYTSLKLLHDPNYVKILNNKAQLNNAIGSLEKAAASLPELSQRIRYKFKQLADILIILNKKYSLLTDKEVSLIKHYSLLINEDDKSPSYYLKCLAELDNISRNIPVLIPEYRPNITSGFGLRHLKKYGITKFHYGLDMKSGSPQVYAAADGLVTFIGSVRGYGNLIILQHKNHSCTKYAHLDKINVKLGQAISQGQSIGIEGNTGTSTAHHLHFEVLVRKRHVNPIDFICYNFNSKTQLIMNNKISNRSYVIATRKPGALKKSHYSKEKVVVKNDNKNIELLQKYRRKGDKN